MNYDTVMQTYRKRMKIEERKALQDFKQSDTVRHCNCVGPRPGEPVCPCRMHDLKVENGRWVEKIDHGPVDYKIDLLYRPDKNPT